MCPFHDLLHLLSLLLNKLSENIKRVTLVIFIVYEFIGGGYPLKIGEDASGRFIQNCLTYILEF